MPTPSPFKMNEFFIKYNNKYLDWDGGFGNQCVDVIKAYFKEVLEREPFKGNAIDYWTKTPQGFERIVKTMFNHPEPGDIVIFNITQYGHIGIVNWWRWFDFNCFQQNDPLMSPCSFKTYNYSKVLGWLRPIKAKPIEVCVVNAENAPISVFKAKLKEYGVNVNIRSVTADLSVPYGTLSGDEAIKLIDKLNIRESFIYILYPANPSSAYEVASFYPAKNKAFCTIPYPVEPTIMVHAFLHLLRKYINFNHLGPYIEDVERYPTSWSDAGNFENPGWAFAEQYNQLKDYLNKI